MGKGGFSDWELKFRNRQAKINKKVLSKFLFCLLQFLKLPNFLKFLMTGRGEGAECFILLTAAAQFNNSNTNIINYERKGAECVDS